MCIRHPFILSENLCGRCGAEFCRECLVFPRGQKLPLCVTCAVSAGGVRAKAAPPRPKRDIKALAKAREREMREASPAPLPEIANPVPAGWAFAETAELVEAPAPAPPARGRRRRPKATPEKPPGDDGDSSDMMSWLDSVYTTD